MAPKQHRDVNFQRIVAEVQEAYGFNDLDLALRLRVSQSAIARLRNGSVQTPSYTLGAGLVAMHDSRPKR